MSAWVWNREGAGISVTRASSYWMKRCEVHGCKMKVNIKKDQTVDYAHMVADRYDDKRTDLLEVSGLQLKRSS